MEKSNKLMLGAALVVALVALAGAGYAAYYYTAETTNSGNSMDATYVTISQNGTYTYDTGTILDNLKYDTVDNNGSFTYKPVADYQYTNSTSTYTTLSGHKTTTDTIDGGHYAALVSSDLSLVVDKTKSNANAAYSLAVESNLAISDGLTYTMILVTGETIKAVENGSADCSTTTANWSFTGLTLSSNSTEWHVYIFVTGSTDEAITQQTGITFKFTLTATVN